MPLHCSGLVFFLSLGLCTYSLNKSYSYCLILLFLKLKKIHFMYINVLSATISMYYTCAWCLWRPEEVTDALGLELQTLQVTMWLL